MSITTQIFIGVIAGASFSFAGAAKNSAQNKEDFSLEKLFDTVLTGAIVGGVGGLVGVEQTTIEEFGAAIVAYGGATQLLRHLFKALKAYLKPRIEHFKRLLTRK